ncbi:MAG TPA: hypothetical protein VNZ49_03560 [Bacteroidia bacterium]|jgi:hypothetical protein|nr:hypothetical protein [Bacteroidia bacterium]
MKRTTILFIFPFLFFLVSCASFHNGAISSGPLLSANDKHVRTAYGHAKTNIVLGFGGGEYVALVHNAKQDLEKNWPLAKGEYYANFTVDFRKTFFFFAIVITNEVMVSADIMSDNPFSGPAQIQGPVISFYKTETDSFFVGETIYMNYDGQNQTPFTFNEFIITGFDEQGFVYLEFTKNSKTVAVDQALLYYSKDKQTNGFNAGDEVVFKKRRKKVKGVILATSPTKALISYNGGFYEKEITEITK